MKHLVFLLEEESAKEFLRNLMPRLAPNISCRFIAFEGKTDLENNIERKLRGYNSPESYFIIIRDQDSGDCHIIKRILVEKCKKSGKSNYSVRIACRELESWYFGDLESVQNALQISELSRFSRKSKYRVPDKIVNPSKELEKITDTKYQKVSGSREIGKFLNIAKNTSHSFNVFVNDIKNIAKD